VPAQVTPSTVRTRDGLALSAWHFLPSGPRARIVLLHGYAEHVGRYPHLIEALTEADGKLPRVVFGHSLGGLLALRYVLHRPAAFAAVAVSSPFLYPTADVPWVQEKVASATSLLAPTLLMKSPVNADGLSHDPAVVQAYVDDPLVFKTINARWFFEVRKAQEEVLERAAEIRLPALFLIGDADPVAQPARSRQVFERLGSAGKQLRSYDGFLHEVLNELGKDGVIEDVVGGWAGVV
jgi:alpha-beta hydrolase superfamily lysophospholipase